MEAKEQVSKGRLWTSRIIQIIVILMFLMGAINNILQTESAIDGAVEMGYPKEAVLYLGIVLLASTILYAVPKTSILGAIILTAWLGGAVATHIIHRDPAFNTFFPVVFGVLIWLSLLLRNKNLHRILLGN